MTNDHTYPDYFARFYDVIYDHFRNETDHDFFLNLISAAKGPVLEVGVGTGRLFKEALGKGADINGIDNSSAMLDVLKQKLSYEDYHRIELQDICEMKFHRKFDLIIAPFRVFMHLLTVKQQLKALARAHKYLLPGGKFVFDLFVPNLKMLTEGVENMKDFDGEYEPGKKLQRFTTMHADPVNQISHVTFRFVWQEAGTEQTRTWKTDLRLIFRYELQHLLSLSKFEDYKIYGDFLKHKLTKDSKEFVVVCKR